MTAETGHIEAGGHRLEIARHPGARPEAPTLVLLHEGLGCVALWRDFPARLAAATGCAVVAYSRAGYGGSDPCALPRPLDYMTREAVDVLPEVLSQMGLGDHILVGHSDGATIAAIHAGRAPAPGLRGVCLIAPHFFTEPGGLAAIAAAREAYAVGDLRDRLAKYHGDVDAAFRGWNDAWLDPGFRDWNVEAVLDDIRVPLLALQGDADPYGTLAQVEVVSRRAGAAVETRILAGIGHAPHVEATEDTVATVAAFTARCLEEARA